MKKLICLLLSGLLICSLAACGASGKGDEGKDFVWTREGYFADEDDNLAYIIKCRSESHEAWDVGVIFKEDSYGNEIQQEGKTLHGNLAPDFEDRSYIVTISEEGEDGILLVVEGGGTYHLTYTEIPEEAFTVTVRSMGEGYFAYAAEDEDLPEDDDDDDFRTSVQLSLSEPETYSFIARAEENWQFVKWTRDGEDCSFEAQITLELTEATELVAVFEEAG